MNNRCLCCGKPLNDNAAVGEWHRHCLHSLFADDQLPLLDVSSADIKALATKALSNHLAIPGIQKKLSLGLSKKRGCPPRFTFLDYPSGYILKPPDERYPFLPEYEALTMTMADVFGLPSCPHALIRLKDGALAYITKRIDRKVVGKEVKQIPMEDFCQLSNRLTEDKYQGSYEQIAKLIDRYSADGYGDKAELFNRLLFCFLTLNSDMHLKNFSLIENEEGKMHLSPAYDLLPTTLLLPSDKEDVALTLHGKKSKLTRKDFLLFAESIGIPSLVATRLIERSLSFEKTGCSLIEESFLDEATKTIYQDRFKRRIALLRGEQSSQ